jgi:outer membrane protein TolC
LAQGLPNELAGEASTRKVEQHYSQKNFTIIRSRCSSSAAASPESAQAGAQASAADVENARLSARSELARDYVQLQSLDRQKRLLEAAAADFQKSLQLTNNRYNAAVASRADVLQAETQLKTRQAQAVDLGAQRAQLEHAIAVLIGKPAAAVSIVEANPVAPPRIPVRDTGAPP